jgi:poly(glycerol-phosphate) alpha-glucosyltransferase
VSAVTEHRLPPGRYLSCPIDVSADYGGQTRALLRRNRFFASHAGIRPAVLMFGPAPDLDQRRAALLEHGLITPAIDLVNIYEQYRSRDWSSATPVGRPLADLSAHRTYETAMSDGTPFRATYELPDRGGVINEYLRPDGSPFLRIPEFTFRDPSSWPDRVQLISNNGDLVEEHASIGQWFRTWIDELAPADQDTFLFMDSRFIAPHLAPIERDHIHLIYQLHNVHLSADRSWNSPLNDEYQRLLRHLGDMDAFVTLTERQQADVAQRFGRRSNLFVVPNTIDLPDEPEHVQRDPRLVTVVARLEGQKRLGHVLKAFRRVVDRLPDARLDVYGDGTRRPQLEKLAARLDLTGAVTFKGHDSSARDSLWWSSAFVLTSQYEGYPLSTLESFSHGCPVVAYDIKYGPREQITDGVDGFLVPDGDIGAVADRIVRLLQDPGLVRRMSPAARRKAGEHGADRFVADWNRVLTRVVELKPSRTRLRGAGTRIDVLRVRRGPLSLLRHNRAADRLLLRAHVRLDGTSRRSTLEDVEVAVDVVDADGRSTGLPVRTSVSADGVHVRCRASLHEPGLLEASDARRDAELRLRVVWENSAWETVIGRPAADWTDIIRP